MGLFCKECGALLPPNSENDRCVKCRNDNIEKQTLSENLSNKGLFPFREVREGQKQFMKDAEKALRKGTTLISHAPTGIGKTAAVLTSAFKAKSEEQTIFFLTSKQSQHRIAIKTVQNMPSQVRAIDVISKKHMCPREESSLPYPVFENFCSEKGQNRCNLFNKEMSRVVDKLKEKTRHVEEIVDICKSMNVCPHKAALIAGSDADIIVCDYNYVFDDIRERIFELLDMELENAIVIVDEAHNLPDRVRNHLEDELTQTILQESFQLLQGQNSSLSSFIKRLSSELRDIGGDERRISKEFLDKRLQKALRGGLGQYGKIEDLMSDLEMLGRELLEKDFSATAPIHLFSFLSKWMIEGDEVFRSYEPDPLKIKVRLLDPAKITADIFERISGSVLMSGTLHPGEMYADLLGVKKSLIRKYESPFPDENRRIISVKNLTTSYKQRDIQMFQAYANTISDVANNTPGNVAVFFPSYNLLNRIADRLNRVYVEKEMLIEDKKYAKWEKEELVDTLKTSNDNILLAVQGGSLSEGVDYRNNILSAVLIAGIPFPPPSLELDALEEYYTKKFDDKKGYEYARIYPALNRVLQAAGRCIRSKKDRGLILLMDNRFNYTRYKNMMPEDFEYYVSTDVVKECKEFFGG